jgi:hypothetical protein
MKKVLGIWIQGSRKEQKVVGELEDLQKFKGNRL